MTLELSRKVQRIKPSITLAISAKAKEMQAKGIDVLSFGAGEPDFDTPENIKTTAINAIQKGETKYTASSGTPALKKAIQQKFVRENNLVYDLKQIIVNAGAKHSLYNVFQAILNKDDEVIIPAPYWVSYPDMVLLAEGKPVIVQTKPENGFQLTLQDIVKEIRPKTKAIVLNSPCNPSGVVYSRTHLEELARYLESKDIYLVSDEIYEHFLYDNRTFYSIANYSDNIKQKTIVVNGVSKAYAMTGWRIGFIAGPEEVIKAVDVIQSQSLSNPTSISQAATVEALSGDQSSVRMMLRAFDERRQYMVKELNQIPGITCALPQGAFYAFPDVRELFGKKYNGIEITGSMELANLLLNEAHVAVVPGIGFGTEGFIRLSYACSMQTIEQGIVRIRDFVAKLS